MITVVEHQTGAPYHSFSIVHSSLYFKLKPVLRRHTKTPKPKGPWPLRLRKHPASLRTRQDPCGSAHVNP